MVNESGQQMFSDEPIAVGEYVQVEDPRDDSRALIELERPPFGAWRDGICDCFTNCWPSCYCSFCCYHGIWMTSQIAQKSGFAKFQNVFFPFFIAYVASYALQVVFGQTIVWVLIAYGVSLSHIILSVLIRLHIVAKYEIKSQSVCMECMTGFFCFCCSTAQMARHMVGYRKILDGDLDVDMPDHYNRHV